LKEERNDIALNSLYVDGKIEESMPGLLYYRIAEKEAKWLLVISHWKASNDVLRS